MLKKYKVINIVSAILIIISLSIFYTYATEEPEQQTEIEKNLLNLESSSITEKYIASEYLKKLTSEELGPAALSKAKELFLHEMEQLRHYSELVIKPGKFEDNVPKELRYLNELEWRMYFNNLRDIAAKSKDITLLPQLIDAKVSPEEIQNFGDSAITPIIALLQENTNNHINRVYAVRVLVHLLKEKARGYVAREEAREKIKSALIDRAVNDKDNALRGVIVRSLGDLRDMEFVPMLENLAQNDKWNYEAVANPKYDKGVQPGQRIIRHPIRKMAQEALERIKKKGSSPD